MVDFGAFHMEIVAKLQYFDYILKARNTLELFLAKDLGYEIIVQVARVKCEMYYKVL